MDAIAVVVMLLALLALAGVVAFFLYDYFKHKEQNDKSFEAAKKHVEAEKGDRVSNIKFVVDQVNEVNQDIYQTMTSNVDLLRQDATTLQQSQYNLQSGLDKFLRFSSNVPTGMGGAPVTLRDLPGTATPDVHLIRHVTAVMGITASDLGKDGNLVELCNPDRTRCIRFPDAKGDTYLTSLDASKNVVVDAPMHVTGEVKLMNTVSGTQTSIEQATLLGRDQSLLIQTGKVGIGSVGFAAPTASLHVQAFAGQDAFKVSANASDALLVSASGELVTTKPIHLRATPAGGNMATLELAGGSNLKITTAKVELDGDVQVKGNLTVEKDLQITGMGRIGTTPIAVLGATTTA
jgi:hypothetical protein